MKEILENAFCAHLRKVLPEAYRAFVVEGHSQKERPLPYICVDCDQQKFPEGLSLENGLFECGITVSIADSAHSIDYAEQRQRVRAVMATLESFAPFEEMDLCLFEFEEDTDARDDNNIGNVLKYTAIVQI